MADALATPKKKVPLLNCFLCDKTRYYSLCGKKTTDIVTKIDSITNIDFKSFLERNKENYTSVCKACYRQINKTYLFLIKLKSKLESTAPTQREKRQTCSPITPKVKGVKSRSSVKKLCSASRPSLLSVSLPESPTISTASEKQNAPTAFSFDHSYSSKHANQTAKATTTTTDSSRLLQKHLQRMGLNQKNVPEESHCMQRDVIQEIINTIFSNEQLLRAVQNRLIEDLNAACSSLSTRSTALSSILMRNRDFTKLLQHGDTFFSDVIHEISERTPFLLDMFTTVVTAGNEPREQKVMAIVAAYAILMKSRNEKLSAWHRMTTLVAVKGHLDDSALTRFNRMGLTLCTTSKLRLLDEAGDAMDTGIVCELSKNPLVKVTGDNLDIYIKTGHMSLDKANKDLHLFASNIIFSRIAKPGLYSTLPLQIPVERIKPEMFFPTRQVKETLLNSYCIILGRILVNLDAFSWLRPVLPAHIYHPFESHMSQKSSVYQLPIMMKNEAKHEDCVDILDSYEAMLNDLYTKALGSADLLRKFHVPCGGDQLTRVRLTEAKNLRNLATTPVKRFEDLQPFIIELWHTKQDFIEKCYKELYSTKTLRQPGTLYHYKAKLRRTDVTGKVKGAFKSHHDFLLLVGNQLIINQFLEYFGMDNVQSVPTKNVPNPAKSVSERGAQMHTMLTKFITQYDYLETAPNLSISDCDDNIYNYCSNLCQWVLPLLMLEDIVKEGDITRLIPCLMLLMQFFFSHSRLSKYFQECLDFILKCEFLLSPMQRVRVLEGAFTNLHGGIGRNIESDLVQENSVRNQKDLIRSLGANKSDQAIMRCTKAADNIAAVCSKIDLCVTPQKKSSHHQVPRALRDEEVIHEKIKI